jgi:hypothetical protein
MQQANYRFYATLLDSYQWYLDSEGENCFQELIDKINRVPFAKSEAALKGIAFNTLVDSINEKGYDKLGLKSSSKKEEITVFDGKEFKTSLVCAFSRHFKGAASQVYTSAYLETDRGLVELYGFADKVLQDIVSDIKCTGKYEFPKFIKNWQHKVYPYCFNQNDIQVSVFDYAVTDYNNFYIESYFYKPEVDIPALQNICVDLICFLEKYRDLITDKKIFNLK